MVNETVFTDFKQTCYSTLLFDLLGNPELCKQVSEFPSTPLFLQGLGNLKNPPGNL